MRLKDLGKFFLFIFILAIAFSSYAGARKVNFKLNLPKGTSYLINFNVDQDIQQTIQGQEQNMSSTMVMDYVFDTLDVDKEGNMLCKIIYERVAARQSGPTGSIEYNSSEDTEPTDANLVGYAALVGESFEIKISPQGLVGELKGTEVIIDKIVAKLNIPDGPQKTFFEQNLKNEFGDKAMKEMMQNMFAIWPENAVGVGDSWEKTIAISRGMPLTIDTIYTVKSIKKDSATIQISSTIKSDPETAINLGAGAKLFYDISGTQEGRMHLKISEGWIENSTIEQTISGTAKLEGNPQMPEGLSWPMRISSSISVQSSKK